MKRFVKFAFVCVGDDGARKVFELSNRYTVVTIDNSVCKMPLEVCNSYYTIT